MRLKVNTLSDTDKIYFEAIDARRQQTQSNPYPEIDSYPQTERAGADTCYIVIYS